MIKPYAHTAPSAPAHRELANQSSSTLLSTAPSLKRDLSLIDGAVDQTSAQSHLADQYAAMKAAAEKAKEAQDQADSWSILGAVIMVPIIGTLIGTAIGDASIDQENQGERGVSLFHRSLFAPDGDRDP